MTKPTVVQFGAGAIGRGFLGQLWTEGGYEVVFVDVQDDLIAALNQKQSYPLRLVESDGSTTLSIAPVRAVSARDSELVARELAGCAFACTAVGVSVFTRLAPLIAAGVEQRAHQGNPTPLNVLCCENQKNAASLLRQEVARHFSENVDIAFVDASVGRMVPPPTPELLSEDSLLIVSEAYKELPIDASAWRGSVPGMPGLLPKQNFEGYVARKLFTHNGGHALLAYHGWLKGFEYVWQCADDNELQSELCGLWNEVRPALVSAYGFDADEQEAHEADLLRRFRNRALGDTVIRVGRDPARKLRADDRLVGAALLCQSQGIEPRYAARAIAAALCFRPPDDAGAGIVQEELQRRGVVGALGTLSGIAATSPLAGLVEDAYNVLARP